MAQRPSRKKLVADKAASNDAPAVPTTALARPGDPYVEGKGTVLRDRREPQNRDLSPGAHIRPATFRPTVRRNMRELPAQPHILKAVSVVFMYTMMGVGDREIADMLQCTSIEVEQIRALPAYAECFESVMGVFVDANSELLTSRIAAYSHDALSNVATLMDSDKDEISLSAAKDLLDRAGARPQDINAKRAGLGNELRIVISKGDAGANVGVDINVNGVPLG